MKKIMGTIAAFFLLAGCGAENEVSSQILEKLKQGSGNNPVFAEFLEKNGEKLEKANFEPEKMGIPLPKDEELDSSFYDEIIVGLSEIAQEEKEEAILSFLAKHANEGVRSEVAKNPALSSELQAILAKDENSLVRSYLGANPQIKNEIAMILSGDKNESVRRPLAQNAIVAPEILEKFVTDANPEVQRSLVRNKNLTPELMEKIAQESVDSTVSELIKREDLPAELREKIKTDRPKLFENTTE